ncbi:hypothetical protein AB0J66_40010, partial [Actinoplanes sp. NPDC049598]
DKSDISDFTEAWGGAVRGPGAVPGGGVGGPGAVPGGGVGGPGAVPGGGAETRDVGRAGSMAGDKTGVRAGGSTGAGGGTGIAGMRARAQSLGGTLEAGAVDGGFLVSVLLPTPGEEGEC